MTSKPRPILVLRGVPVAWSQADSGVVGDFTLSATVSRIPQALSTEVDIFAGSLGAGAQAWTVSANDLNSEILMGGRPISAGRLANNVSLASTTVDLRPSGRFSEGDTIWINGESIVLGPSLPQTGFDRFTGCTRGAYLSRAQVHDIGPRDNINVYLAPPMAGREVLVFPSLDAFETLDPAEATFRGVVDDIESAEDMAGIQVSIRDVLGLFVGVESGDEQVLWRTSSLYSYGEGRWFIPAVQPRRYPYGSGAGDYYHLQFEDTLILAEGGTSRWADADIPEHPLSPPRKGAGIVPVGDDFDGTGNFVLAFGYALTLADGTYVGSLPEDPSNPDRLHHPLYALLVYMLSGDPPPGGSLAHPVYDYWRYGRGMSLPADFIDVDGIEALIDQTPDVQVRAQLLGWDGSKYTAAQLLKILTVPYGFFPAWTPNGRLTIRRREFVPLAEATEIPYSDIVAFSESQHRRFNSAARSVVGEYGEPWQTATNIELVDAADRSLLWKPHIKGKSYTFDVRGMPSPNVNGEGGAASYLEDVLQWSRFDLPEVRFKFSSEETIAVGSYLSVDPEAIRVFWDSRGERAAVAGEVSGVVISCAQDYGNGEWEVTLLATSFSLIEAPRQVFPSARVVGGTDGFEPLLPRYTPSGEDRLDLFDTAFGNPLNDQEWFAFNKEGTIIDVGAVQALDTGDPFTLGLTNPLPGDLDQWTIAARNPEPTDPWAELSEDSPELGIYV